jgi:hypothetical protein
MVLEAKRRTRSRSPAAVAAALALLSALSGCFSMSHTVGAGPRSGIEQSETRWFALYGMVPLEREFDSQYLAGGATDYRVTTQFTPVDVLLTSVASFATFYRQTVTVER